MFDCDPVAHLAVGIVVELRRAADLDVAQRLRRIDTVSASLGSRRRLRYFCLPASVLTCTSTPSNQYQTGEPWGLPSGRTVLSTAVFGARRRS